MHNDKIFVFGDNIGFVALKDRMLEDPMLKVVNAARISYAKEKEKVDDKDKKLIGFLWANEHTSPFRHSFFTFHLKLPLFVLRQAVKYQVGSVWRKLEVDGHTCSVDIFDLLFDTDKGCSWNEVSGRYVTLEPEFYFPTTMRGNPPHGNKQTSNDLGSNFDHAGELRKMQTECRRAYEDYRARLDRGIAKEIARMFLPQNVYTQVYWTVSLQGVMHFLDQRLKDTAQYEIRQVAEGIKSLLPNHQELSDAISHKSSG